MGETAYTDDFSPLFRSTRDAMDGARWQQGLAMERRPLQVQTRQDVSTLVREIAPKYGVDPRLVEAVIGLESGGQADVISRKGAQGVMQLMPGCLTLDTLCLSASGWKSHNELCIGELILTYNLARHCMEWQPIDALLVHAHPGELVHMQNQGFNFVATLNHKWVVKPWNGHSYELWETQQCWHGNQNTLLRVAPYDFPTEPTLPDAVVFLAGLVFADGSISKHGRQIDLYQTEKIDLFRLALTHAGCAYTEYQRENGAYRWLLRGAVKDHLASLLWYEGRKRLSMAFLRQLTAKQADILWDALLQTDAYAVQAFQNEGYGQSDLDRARDIQTLVYLRGYVSNLRCYPRQERVVIAGREVSQHDRYQALVKKRQTTSLSTTRLAYTFVPEQPVWCPSVANKTWVAWRYGYITITGNTARRFGVTDPLDPAQNIEGGVRYLAWLRDQFPGRTDLQLAGYHAGEGAVRNAGYTIPQTHDGNMSTGQYVATILKRYTPTLPGEEGQPALDVRDALARQSVREGTQGPTLQVTTDVNQLSALARGGKPAQGLPGEGGIPPLDLSRETQRHVMDLPGTTLNVETDVGNLMARTQGQPTALQPGQRPFDAAHPALEPGLIEDRAGRIVGSIGQGAVGMVENILQSVVAAENLVGLQRPAVPGMTDPMGVEFLLPPIKGLEKSLAPRLGGEAPDLVDKLANGIGTSLASLLPGAAAQRFLRGVATVAPGLARLGGAATSGVIEAAAEAGGVYEQMAPLVGEQEASKRALTSFAANAVLVTATDKLGIFGEEARLLRRALAGAISNGAQEAMQYDIERRQLWVPASHQAADGLKAAGWVQEGTRLVKPFAVTEMGEAALIGMLIGGPAAAAVSTMVEGNSPTWAGIVEQETDAAGGTVDPHFNFTTVVEAAQQPDTPPPGVEPSTWQRWGAYLTNLLPDIQPGPGGGGGILGGERGSLGTGGPTLRGGAEGLTPERYRTPSGGWRIPLRDMPSQELDLKDFIVQQGGIKLTGEELRGELEAVISRKETGLFGLQNNASGLSLQAMAETAEQQGFIPSADKEALLQALDRNIVQGHPVPSVYATGRIALLDDPYVSAGYQAVLDAVEAVRGRTEEQVAGVRHRRAVHAEAAALIEEGAFSHDDIREIFPNTTLNDTMASALVQSLNTVGEEMADAAQRYLDAGARIGSHEEASLQELMALLAELDPIRLGVSAAQSRGLGILNDPLSGYTQFLNNLHRALETAPDKTMAQIAKNILAAKPQQALTKEELAKNPERLAEIFAQQRAMIERFQASPVQFQLEAQEAGNLALFEQLTPEQQALIEASYAPEGEARTPQEWDQVFRAQAQQRLLEAWQAGEFERQRARDALYDDMVNLNQQREAARQRAMEDWSAEDRARDDAYQQAREVWARQAVERADALWREGMRDYRQFQEELRQGYQGRQLDLPPREGEPRREPTQMLLGLNEFGEVQQALTDYREGRATDAQQELLDAVLRPWTATQEQLKLPSMRNLIASVWPGLQPWTATEEGLRRQLDVLRQTQAQAPAQLPVMKALMDSTRPGFEGYFKELMYNAWLSNPTTHLVNAISNMTVTVWAVPERFIAQSFSADTVGVVNGEASAMLYGLVHGIQDAWVLAYRSFKAGQPLSGLGREYSREPAATAQNMGLNPESAFGKFVDFFFNYIGLGSGGRLPSRLLMASDEFFKMWNYRAELNALAYRDAVRNGYEGTAWADHVTRVISQPNLAQLQEAAKTFSVVQTFQNAMTPGGIGERMQGFADISLRIPLTDQRFPVGRLITPFVQTPSNIGRYFFERTPFGLALSSFRDDLQAGGERADLAKAKVTMGTMAMLGLVGLAAAGRLTGRGPEDRDLRQIWRQTYQPYSVKLPTGHWVSLDRFSPIGDMVKMVGDLVQVAGEVDTEDWAKATLAPVLVFLRGMTNSTYFQALSSFLDIMAPDFGTKESEFGIKLQRFSSRLISGVVQPSSLMAATARFLDPVERDALRLVDALYARVPGWKDDIPARRTLGGEKLLYGWGFSPEILANLTRAFSPMKLGKGTLLLADKEILDNKMRLELPSRSLAHDAVPLGKLAEDVPTSLGGLEPLRLTPEQYERLMVLTAGNEVEAQKLGLEIPEWALNKLIQDLSREYNATPPREVRSVTDFLNWAAEQPYYQEQSSGQGGGKEKLFQRALSGYRTLGKQLLLSQDKSLEQQAGESQILATIRQLPLARQRDVAQQVRTGLGEAATRTREQLGLHVGAPR